MKIYLTTFYFDNSVCMRRPYVTLGACVNVIENYVFRENQFDGRIRFWGKYQDRYLKVITLEDGLTVHNAFFDRNFDLKKRGLE